MTFFCIIDKAGKQNICKLNFYTSNMKRNTYYPDGCNCRKANEDVWNMIMINNRNRFCSRLKTSGI